MASIAMMAGGALVNALAFSSTNFLFGQLNGHEEAKRHNLAMEQLSRARDEFNRQRQQRLDFINQTLRDQRHAEQTFSDLGMAMEQYYKVTGNKLPPLRDPPKLSDFYNPSRQRKDSELLLVAGGTVVVGALAYKFSKK